MFNSYGISARSSANANVNVNTGGNKNIQKTYTNLNINAVSGTLIKTFEKSYFVRVQANTPSDYFYFNDSLTPSKIVQSAYRADALEQFKTNDNQFIKHYESNSYLLEPVYILQVMLCGNDTYLIEAITQQEYDKIFEINN